MACWKHQRNVLLLTDKQYATHSQLHCRNSQTNKSPPLQQIVEHRDLTHSLTHSWVAIIIIIKDSQSEKKKKKLINNNNNDLQKSYKRECPEKSILLGGSRASSTKYFTLLYFTLLTYTHQKSNGTLRIQQLQTTSKMEWNGIQQHLICSHEWRFL
jgi:hypothetical protein